MYYRMSVALSIKNLKNTTYDYTYESRMPMLIQMESQEQQFIFTVGQDISSSFIIGTCANDNLSHDVIPPLPHEISIISQIDPNTITFLIELPDSTKLKPQDLKLYKIANSQLAFSIRIDSSSPD